MTVMTAEVIVLAVKPQQLADVLRALPPLKPEQLVLSIAAGVRASDISRWLGGHPAVVRAMPNTPALVGAGIAGLFALPGVTDKQKAQANRILEAVGHVVWVQQEAQIDVVTAISGSGPAYVFYFIEALEQAGIDLGLPAETARLLTLADFLRRRRAGDQGSIRTGRIARPRHLQRRHDGTRHRRAGRSRRRLCHWPGGARGSRTCR